MGSVLLQSGREHVRNTCIVALTVACICDLLFVILTPSNQNDRVVMLLKHLELNVCWLKI